MGDDIKVKTKCKYLIIGAGIAGIYTGYCLLKKMRETDIIIVEKEDRLGGRIKSLEIWPGEVIELGAGTVPSSAINEIALIKELGLDAKLRSGRGPRSYLEVSVDSGSVGSGLTYSIKSLTPMDGSGFYGIVEDLKRRIDTGEIDPILARCYSFHRMVERVHGIYVADLMKDMYGYDADFLYQDTLDAIKMFTDGGPFAREATSQRLGGGLIQIVQTMADILVKNNVVIKMNSGCVDLSRVDGGQYVCTLDTGDRIRAEYVVFAIPKGPLMKIPYFAPICRTLLNTVFSKCLMRIYIQFPVNSDKCWFDFIEGVMTTSTLLRQIIPVDKKAGLLMIYLDDYAAQTWHYLDKRGFLEQEVMVHLRRTFTSVMIPDPVKIISAYWNEATHVFRPMIDSEIMAKKVLQPFPNESVYIVGEAYAPSMQEWAEGALLTVNNLISVLNNKVAN